jgi:ubiquinol-cytochrome c reductase iron-sulfur subunit
MNEEREGKSAVPVAVLLLGWEVCVGLARRVARIFLEKEKEPGQMTPEAARRAEEEERHKAQTGAVLLVSGVVGWRFAKAVVRRAGGRLLFESRVPREGPGTPTHDSATIVARKIPEVREAEHGKPAAIRAEDCGCSKGGRMADRDLDAERGTNPARRQKWGTVLVVLAFVASVAGGIAFLVTYWTGGSNELLGGMLALCCGGLGVVMVGWARWLTAHKEASESRENSSSIEDHKAASETFGVGAQDIRRRALLGWMAAGGLGLIGAMVISLFRSLGLSPDASLYSTVWKRGQRLTTAEGKPVAADALTPGSTIVVFPENSIGSERAQTVLVRVDPAALRLPAPRTHWAPMGNLAYSRVCTHAGCSVGMYEATAHQLMCPCHQSTFDVLCGAEPTGGPAARPLPQLPLYTDGDGNLRAAGGFSEVPGPGFWGMPS